MINIKKIALITHIESNKNNLNKQLHTILDNEIRMYEEEAINCYTHWRKNAGWLKDINIYSLCSTNNTISFTTKEKLKQLNVKYIEYYNDNTCKFSSGFLTIPYTGYFFENIYQIPEDILIKIDLDNYIQKPINYQIIKQSITDTIIGQYNHQLEDRITFANMLPFDTSLIITNKFKKFYQLYYGLCFDNQIKTTYEWQQTYNMSKDYWLEEYVIDYIYENKLFDIIPLQNYQYGKNYPTLAWFIKNNLTQNLFLKHYHLNYKQ